MATKIRGITVEIGGDTTGLQKALKDTNSQIRNTSAQLKDVEKLLKLDPKNAELLAQKHKLLSERIAENKDKLKALTEAQKQMNADGVDKNSDSYRALQREIIATKQDIDADKKAMKEHGKAADDASESNSKFTETLAGVGKAAAAAAVAVGAAAVKLAKEVISGTAELEQNVGGSEAVFGEYAETMQKTAGEAYKNMGTSASQYLATANKIGALLQGSGMDQAKSVELTAQAMQRAADMASVMGISTEDALNAITGAAKGNYTMMDNLGVKMNATSLAAYALEKGYKKAFSEMTEAEKAQLAMEAFFESTAQYAGNFANESVNTISGAFGMLSASWTDFVAGLGTDGADIEALTMNVVDSLLSVVDNVQPVLQNIIKALPVAIQGMITAIQPLIPDLLEAGKGIFMAILDGIIKNLPSILSTAGDIILMLVRGIVSNLPSIIESGLSAILALVEGISEALPELIPAVVDAILTIVDTLLDNLDMLIDAAINLIMALADGLIKALPILIEKAPVIIMKLVDGLIRNLPKIVEAAFELVGKLATGIIEALPKIGTAAGQLIGEFVKSIKNLATTIWNIGKDIVLGVWNGIKDKAAWFGQQVKQFFKNIIDGVKKVLGIASPSKVFAGIGEFMAQGLGVGFEKEMDDVTDSIDEAVAGISPTITSNVVPATALGATASRAALGTTNNTNNSFGGISITINPAAGTDPHSIAEAVMDEIYSATMRRGAAIA